MLKIVPSILRIAYHILSLGHTKGVNKVAFSADGTKFASASDDRTIRVWDESSTMTLHTFKGHKDGVVGGIYLLPLVGRLLVYVFNLLR